MKHQESIYITDGLLYSYIIVHNILTNVFVIIYIYLYSGAIAHHILIAIIVNGAGNVQTTTN